MYAKKSTAATEYKIAATKAAHDFLENTPIQPKIAPIKNINACGVTSAVAIAPPTASAASFADAVEPTKKQNR